MYVCRLWPHNVIVLLLGLVFTLEMYFFPHLYHSPWLSGPSWVWWCCFTAVRGFAFICSRWPKFLSSIGGPFLLCYALPHVVSSWYGSGLQWLLLWQSSGSAWCWVAYLSCTLLVLCKSHLQRLVSLHSNALLVYFGRFTVLGGLNSKGMHFSYIFGVFHP